jgi:hypothetical protein
MIRGELSDLESGVLVKRGERSTGSTECRLPLGLDSSLFLELFGEYVGAGLLLKLLFVLNMQSIIDLLSANLKDSPDMYAM